MLSLSTLLTEYKLRNKEMKTSNKLLLGLFVLILLMITTGLIYLKIELKKAGLSDSQYRNSDFKLNMGTTDKTDYQHTIPLI
jgi:hypothetical protein